MCKINEAKYYRRGNLVDTVFMGNASAIWKGIEHCLELLKRGIILRIGNGCMLQVWRDPSLPRVFSHRPISI